MSVELASKQWLHQRATFQNVNKGAPAHQVVMLAPAVTAILSVLTTQEMFPFLSLML